MESTGAECPLNDYFVGVMAQYITPDTTGPPPATGSTTGDSNSSKRSGKKRPRDNRVAPEERVCTKTAQGLDCPFGDSCKYSHDVIKYLENKPEDIGPVCHEYEAYGYCRSGLMCRFGSSHIDKQTGKNLTRPVEEGGVVERVSFNVLSKELQNMLRKKSYVPPSERTGGDIQHPESNGTSLESAPSENPSSEYPANTNSSLPSIASSFDSSPYPSADPVKLIDFSNKVYVAPLTTIGNLPFRRILKDFGADITCGEMAMVHNLQMGQSSEWALLRKHESEKEFGIQIAGGHTDNMARFAKILEHETVSDFIDLNCGCPIDVICNRGAGSALMNRPKKLCEIVSSLTKHLTRAVTVKIRTGWDEKNPTGHKLIPELQKSSKGKIAAIMMHGRSRLQRYTGPANWDYILTAARSQDPTLAPIPIIGNGDIFSYEDWKSHQHQLQSNMTGDEVGLSNCAMIGRGAIIKPWLPTEIKDERHWDISASERFDMYKRFVWYGLEHWGSDQQGVNTTRRFLLEWLSFTHRYVPVGLIDTARLPQRISQKPPSYHGRGDLETLLSSPNSKDWIEISKILLGPLPDGFEFVPKHKSNSYPPVAESVTEAAAAECS